MLNYNYETKGIINQSIKNLPFLSLYYIYIYYILFHNYDLLSHNFHSITYHLDLLYHFDLLSHCSDLIFLLYSIILALINLIISMLFSISYI